MVQGAKITLRTVQALKLGEIAWDGELRGFGVRYQKRGKVYVVKTRLAGRQRWFSIGPHGLWTPDTARDRARRILADAANEVDLVAIREARKKNVSVADLAQKFLKDHVRPKRKASTVAGYQDLIERIIVPRLGKQTVKSIGYGDFERLHHELQDVPYQANRVLAVASKMFSWAEKRGYRPHGTNPCKGIDRYAEHKRTRFLSEAELGKLAKALEAAEKSGQEAEALKAKLKKAKGETAQADLRKALKALEGKASSPFAAAAIRLLIFTGARLREILGLRWEHVDLKNAMLHLPDSKTGAKVVYLSPPALGVLDQLPRIKGNPFVIIGEVEGAALVNLHKPWRRIRKAAGLGDVRLHDLRHSFASVGAAGGASLPIIGALLGHTQAATTARYAHLSADPLKAANEAIGQRIAAAMKGEGAEVVAFKAAGTRKR